jgi:hypothetical protein
LVSYRFLIYENHPGGHVVTQLDPYAVQHVMRRVYTLDVREYFSSRKSILKSLGNNDIGIDKMIKCGMVSETCSNHYLPD